MIKKKIAFRADGNSQIGLGHLVRSGALAGYLQTDFDCLLYTRCVQEDILNNLRKNFHSIIQLESPPEEEYRIVKEQSPIVVLDGYHFDGQYQRKLKSDDDLFLVCIDDLHSVHFFADLIINTAGGIQSHVYSALPECRFYCGPRFALLRESFLKASLKNISKNKKLLVCMGGADPSNYTLHAIHTVLSFSSFEKISIVIGSGYLYKEDLESKLRGNEKIDIHHNLNEIEMASIMMQCDTAICAASGVAYEYLCVGGLLYIIKTAENQTDSYKYLLNEKLAFDISQIGTLSAEEIKKSEKLQKSVFDGKAKFRIQKLFSNIALQSSFSIRTVTENDLEAWYTISNDPEVRSQSYNQKAITIEEHKNWFQSKLQDHHSFLYLVENHGTLIGQLRFLISGDIVTFGYAIEASHRGKGLGSSLISMGIKIFRQDYAKPFHLHAYVKNGNMASQRSFERLSFTKSETQEFPDSILYTLKYAGDNNR